MTEGTAVPYLTALVYDLVTRALGVAKPTWRAEEAVSISCGSRRVHRKLDRPPSADKLHVLDIVRSLGIEVVDQVRRSERWERTPESSFPFGLEAHYNDRGYQTFGRGIVDYIRKRGPDSGP